MNRTYRFHPGEYELGENEKFYGDMEARGWRLERRGGCLSRFVRTEPGGARYRVEVSSRRFLEDPALAEGQLAVFEDCGWEYICSQGFLHIFRAGPGSGAPEFYNDPAEQAGTLKKVRRDLFWGAAAMVLVLALAALSILLGVWKAPGQIGAEQLKRFVQFPTAYAAYALWLAWTPWQTAWGLWKINRTYARLKRGLPLDHSPKGNRILRRALNRGLLALALLCLLLTAAQLAGVRTRDLPAEPEGPYLMLEDLGWTWERGSLYGGRESAVTYTRSLLADCWETLEVQEERAGGRQVWMRQSVYRLRFPGMAEALARALMEDAVFARGGEDFRAVEAPGLDAAWTARDMELVAVRGDLVLRVEALLEPLDRFDPQEICAALAERWAAF